MAGFAGTQSMAINQPQKNLVAEPLPADLTGSVNDGIRFVGTQVITVPAIRLRTTCGLLFVDGARRIA
jgi:hypothetical protein